MIQYIFFLLSECVQIGSVRRTNLWILGCKWDRTEPKNTHTHTHGLVKFHFKPYIQRSVLSTEPFLKDIFGLRNLKNNFELLVIFFCVFSHIFKTLTKNKLKYWEFETLLDIISKCTCKRKVLPYIRGMEEVLVHIMNLSWNSWNIITIFWLPMCNFRTYRGINWNIPFLEERDLCP